DYALVLLELPDANGYRAACGTMLGKFADTRTTVVTSGFGNREVFIFGRSLDAQTAALIAWVCCLAPDAVPGWDPPLQLARRAAAADPEGYPSARALGACLYRAGRFEEAAKQLEAALPLHSGPGPADGVQPSPSVWLLLAMAQHGCKRPDQAKEWLGK